MTRIAFCLGILGLANFFVGAVSILASFVVAGPRDSWHWEWAFAGWLIVNLGAFAFGLAFLCDRAKGGGR